MRESDVRIDSRAWIAWAVAAATPMLIGRNPLVIAEVLIAVVAVRSAWAANGPYGARWLVRLGGALLVVGVLFNVLTVHAGDTVLGRLPESWPVIGGPLTLNAMLYGIVSAAGLLTLLLIGTATASVISPMDLFHALPQRLAPIAVALSVTMAFLPQTATAFRQIREAQTMRGHRSRGGRDIPPLVVPLLAGGLERSLTTAEVLEARGFGTSVGKDAAPRRWRWAPPLTLALALVALLAGAYCLLAGFWPAAIGLLALGGIALAGAYTAGNDRFAGRTRYRPVAWHRRDTIVAAVSGSVLAAVIVRNIAGPAGLQFDPYPAIQPPGVDLSLLIALAGLLVPAVFTPGIATPWRPAGQ